MLTLVGWSDRNRMHSMKCDGFCCMYIGLSRFAYMYTTAVQCDSIVTLFFVRYYVLFRLPQLTFLDSRPVTNNERIEAKRVGAFMQVVKPNDESVK